MDNSTQYLVNFRLLVGELELKSSSTCIGLSDGLTVPFALTAGLSSLENSKFVVLAGVSELVAGSISMGLGGYIGEKSEIEHYNAEKAREWQEVMTVPEVEEQEIVDIFSPYGMSRREMEPLLKNLRNSPDLWSTL
ncbi:UNVERIFIED_CONTAM: hypothetical protein HDU68_012812 [Siphonaria sp. JEL0065]|nr:hypothetical protein HDU68_012812 [Siphonaria sp. JEL0065]